MSQSRLPVRMPRQAFHRFKLGDYRLVNLHFTPC